ncbi:RNA 3'-terminal phosphate cyclase [Pseudomonas mediterranea]|uniref:RNA 3'-terminal phosphate cyclase n=1 Tax=Pseudomonas mediterranea TaxID=183795 RepID=UPI00191E9253|nr:RNA 3'-terminal phosphate cyclase [Pseudomonas mediterranea]MBL0844256.1 RNA 3'-terminal phosphate cyclase [Pseudomonas mediterranea]
MGQDLILIDGTEGGGQVLRTALSLSMITGQAFQMTGIRGKRSRPGLLRQHLTAVRAAAEICGAKVLGAELNSTAIEFRPGTVKAGEYSFAIGTAGSTILVLQTLLPALLRATGTSTVRITGGTHNPAAPPFDFIEQAWLPLIRRMGAQVELALLRHGFVPCGGGVIEATIRPSTLQPLVLDGGQAPVTVVSAGALVSGIPVSIGNRELDRLSARLKIERRELSVTDLGDQAGPGNVVSITATRAGVTEVFASIGQERVRAEQVADVAVDELMAWTQSNAAVGNRLADQLMLPMAIAGAGKLTTERLSNHIRTNAAVIQQFIAVDVCLTRLSEQGNVVVELHARQLSGHDSNGG